MSIHIRLQSAVEKAFFKGQSTRRSVYLTYVIGNLLLMLILSYVVLYNFAYDWTGRLYPAGSGFRLETVFDSAVPFVPEMVIFYIYLFSALVVFTMFYFAFIEYKRGYALGWSLVAIFTVAIFIYIVFPVSTFWYRQELLTHPMSGNFWADRVYQVFASDTSFNCFPSLHAALSAICSFTWFQYAKMKPGRITKIVAFTAFIIAVGVILSTLFIKQHYIADAVAGMALALIIGKILFDKLKF